VDRVGVAARAVLLHLEPVGVVPPVLVGDVVALLALPAGERDLGADVAGLGSHVFPRVHRGPGGPEPCRAVAGAGLEPATPRLWAVCSNHLSYPATIGAVAGTPWYVTHDADVDRSPERESNP